MGETMKIGDEVTFPLPRYNWNNRIQYINGIIIDKVDKDTYCIKHDGNQYYVNKDLIIMKAARSIFWDKVIDRIKNQNINTIAINHNICPNCAEENTLMNKFWVDTGSLKCSNCGYIIDRKDIY